MKPIRRIVAFSICYWAIVFAVGFAMGILRTLLVVPHLGEIYAELLEAPFLIFASWWTARTLNKRRLLSLSQAEAIVAGTLAVLILIGAEISLTDLIRGVDFKTWYAERSVPSTFLFSVLAIGFAIVPIVTR